MTHNDVHMKCMALQIKGQGQVGVSLQHWQMHLGMPCLQDPFMSRCVILVKETEAEPSSCSCSSSAVPRHCPHTLRSVPHLSKRTHVLVLDPRSRLISPCSRTNASSRERTGLRLDERANKLLLTRRTDKK